MWCPGTDLGGWAGGIGPSQVVLVVKNPLANARVAGDAASFPGSGRPPGGRAWQPTPVFLPGVSPWTEVPGGLQSMGVSESDTTEAT